ncbi:MAG: cobalamin-binding protein [Phycisphaerae bacterium]|nr:cobalamin-binding protein [Phycisphaerae bacterium]
MADLQGIASSLIAGKRDEVATKVRAALDEGANVEEVLNKGLIAGMQVVGEKFKNNEFYVPEVLIAARAMKAGMEILSPKLKDAGVKPVATVVIGTVKGDLHDIGKNLVAMMLQGGGFEVVDLGTDVPPEKFVSAAQEKGAQVVAMSALLTTTMPQMANVVKAMKEAGLGGKVKAMIGGAPVTQNYADEIGADGYAPDAASAVETAQKLSK